MALSIEHCTGDDDRFNVYFNDIPIQTLVTHEPLKVINWISGIETAHRYSPNRLLNLIVGLDVEWRPSFSPAQNPVATLQLCVNRSCLIFQPLHCSRIPDKLFSFLADPNHTFFGVGTKEDVEKLTEDYNLRVSNIVDLRHLAVEKLNDRSLKNVGLKDLTLRVVGEEIQKPKKVRMGRWDREYLDSDQIQYACLDAYLSFEIGRILNEY